MTARLDGAALAIELEATNDGAQAAPVGLGLHPYVAVSAFGGDREHVRAYPPGRAQRRMDGPFPTGEMVPSRSSDVGLPPMGHDLTVVRTDLGSHPVARLVASDGRPAVVMELAGAFRELALWAPPDQPSIALEPLTCALSAASLPPDHASEITALAPKAHLQAAVTLYVEDV